MKNLIPIIFIILVLASILPLSEGTPDRPIEITALTINFDKTDAIFTVNYDLGTLPKMYILLLGGKSIEPKIKDVFSNFDFDIMRIDQNKAVLRVRNVSRLEKGYYLHDSRKLGTSINTIIVYTPDSEHPTEYFGMNSTPNKFYRS